jgi:hypothetical protein
MVSPGDKLWLVPSYSSRGSGREVTVARVGRVWITTQEGGQYDKQSWRGKAGRGTLYPSQQAYVAEVHLQQHWEGFQKGLPRDKPEHVRDQDITDAQNILGLGEKGVDHPLRHVRYELNYEKTLRFNREADRPEALDTDDYRTAPGDRGPKAFTWKDKPHRLVYSLCEEVERVRAVNAAIQTELATARTALEDMKIQRDELKLRNALLQAGRLP